MFVWRRSGLKIELKLVNTFVKILWVSINFAVPVLHTNMTFWSVMNVVCFKKGKDFCLLLLILLQ